MVISATVAEPPRLQPCRCARARCRLISPERYEQLIAALEDAEDVAAFDVAIAEEGPNVLWEEVKADLGWT